MNYIKEAINSLKAEIQQRQEAIRLLATIAPDGNEPSHANRAVRKARGGKRKLTKAGREAIRAAVKRRWARVHAAKKKAAK